MEIILIILSVGILCMGCFFVGAKVGQTAARGETIEAPNLNPIEVIREQNEKKHEREQEERERARFEIIMENIENYDGTPQGQKDVPRG